MQRLTHIIAAASLFVAGWTSYWAAEYGELSEMKAYYFMKMGMEFAPIETISPEVSAALPASWSFDEVQRRKEDAANARTQLDELQPKIARAEFMAVQVPRWGLMVIILTAAISALSRFRIRVERRAAKRVNQDDATAIASASTKS